MPNPAPADSAPDSTGSNLPAPQRPGGLSRHFRKSGDDVPIDRHPHLPAEPVVSRREEDQEIEDLTSQLRDLVAKKKARERPREEEHAKRERMTRSGNVNLAVMIGAGPDAVPEDAASLGDPVKPAPAPANLASPLPQPAPSPNFTGPAPVYYGDSVPPPREISPLVWILPVAALISFGIGYLVGGKSMQPTAPADPPPGSVAGPSDSPAPAPSGIWKENTVATLDRAMALDREGDPRAAFQIVSDLRKSDPLLPGLTRYAAELQTRLGEFTAPESELSREISSGRDLPQVHFLRAFNTARQRQFNDTFKHLQAALLRDPFNADGLYQMCELLRRQGRFGDAIVVGQQALLRVRPGYGLSLETIGLKLRLAQLENGNVGDVDAAWQEAQKSPPLTADWMLVGAALALQQRNLPKAAEWLGKARAALPKEDFENAIDDYYFRNHTLTGPLTEFRLSDAQRAQRTLRTWEFFIDP